MWGVAADWHPWPPALTTQGGQRELCVVPAACCWPARLLIGVVFKIYFILITKVVHTVGECASNHISVCPFSCRHSLCEPSRGDCFVGVHFYIYTVFMGNLIHFFKVKFLVTFYFDISCSQSTLVDPIPRFTN